MAADLACRGFEVRLFNRSAERISEVALRGEIELEREDGTTCVGRLQGVTSDIAEALDGADVIMVVVPASGHRDIARKCAPHLRDGQIVLLNPGRTGGAIEFRRILNKKGCRADIILAEACTFIFASRSTGIAQAKIFRRKNAVPVAALPATDTPAALEVVSKAYPQFIPARNVLYTSLDNIGAIFHPTMALLNTGWIESTKGDFQFYIDGATRSIAHVLEMLDIERMTVAASLGVQARPAVRWLRDAYSAEGLTLYEAIQANPGYMGMRAPRNLRHRYIYEDVPFSLVPIASLGAQFGVDTRTMDAVIRIACAVHNTNYYQRGRTVEDMGLKGLSIVEIKRYAETGRIDLKEHK
jgi:opine dehydrogenase